MADVDLKIRKKLDSQISSIFKDKKKEKDTSEILLLV
jgi:hypothetical protein